MVCESWLSFWTLYLQMFTDIVHWFLTVRVIPVIAFPGIDCETIFPIVNLIGLPGSPVCIPCYAFIGSRPDPFIFYLYIVSCRPELTLNAWNISWHNIGTMSYFRYMCYVLICGSLDAISLNRKICDEVMLPTVNGDQFLKVVSLELRFGFYDHLA